MPSTPDVTSESPICTSALPAMKRSSIAAPSAAVPPNAALRAWVRAFSTGMAASLSVSNVTSDDER